MVAKPGVCDLLNEPYATPSEIKALAQRAEQASTGVLDAGSLSAANAAAFSELQSASLAFKVTVGREAYRLSLAPGTKTNLEERPTLAEARFRLNAACRAYES